MSALARFFHRRGDTVSGYDRTPSPLTDELRTEGIDIHFDDNPDLIPAQVDLVVYTPAVPAETLERSENGKTFAGTWRGDPWQTLHRRGRQSWKNHYDNHDCPPPFQGSVRL